MNSSSIDQFRIAVADMRLKQKVLSARALEREYKIPKDFLSRNAEAKGTMKRLREEFGDASREQVRQKAKTRLRATKALDQLELERRSLSQRNFCKEFGFSVCLFRNYPDIRDRLNLLNKKPSVPPAKVRKVQTSKPKPSRTLTGVNVKLTAASAFERRRATVEIEKLQRQQNLILEAFRFQATRTANELIRSISGQVDRNLIDLALKDLVDTGRLRLSSRTPRTYQLLDYSTYKGVAG
jgi:hypothetical protein